jgi:hypothetical protein
MTGRKPPGEPYDLAGKRLVFANWHFIMPPFCWWYEDQGNMLDRSVSAGVWDAACEGAHAHRCRVVYVSFSMLCRIGNPPFAADT